jgi:hypothetical protein
MVQWGQRRPYGRGVRSRSKQWFLESSLRNATALALVLLLVAIIAAAAVQLLRAPGASG